MGRPKTTDSVLPCGCYLKVVVVDGEKEPEIHISPCRVGCPHLTEIFKRARPKSIELRFRP